MKSYKKYAFLIVFLCAIFLVSSTCISAAGNANDTSIDTGAGDATVLDTQESTSANDGNMAMDAAGNKKSAGTTGSAVKSEKTSNNYKENSLNDDASGNAQTTAKTNTTAAKKQSTQTTTNNNQTVTSTKSLKKASTFDVSTYDDLYDKLKEADDTEITINLQEGTYNITKTITSFNSATTVTINGNNSIINGQKACQFMSITSGITVNLNNITITNCTSELGGAIENYGTLNINDTSFSNNMQHILAVQYIIRVL